MPLPDALVAAARPMRRQPRNTFSIVVVLALALAGGTTTIGLFSAAVMAPLPYKEPEALALVWHRQAGAMDDAGLASVHDIGTLHGVDGLSAAAGASGRWTTTVGAPSGSERMAAQYVTGGLFDTLGVAPLFGRTLQAADDVAGAAPVVVLSERAWQRWYARSPAVLGTLLAISGRAFEIVGVMPSGFSFIVESRAPDAGRVEEPVDAWLTTAQNPLFASSRRVRWLSPVVRLGDPAHAPVVSQRLEALAARLAAEQPDTRRGVSLELQSLHAHATAHGRRTIGLVGAAVGLLWLLATTNVANLLILQLTRRGRELAVREALGASRGHLARQLVSEALLVCVTAGVVGTAMAWAALRVFASTAEAFVPRAGAANLTPAVAVAGLVLAIVTGIACGLVSTWAARTRPSAIALREGPTSTSSRQRHVVRDAMVGAQVALAVILLVATGLLLRALDRVARTDPGFVSENVLVFSAGLSGGRLDDPAARNAAIGEIEGRVRALPDVAAVGVVTRLPLYSPANANVTTQVFVEGRPVPSTGPGEIDFRRASTGYFRAMGIPILAGRGFTDEDARSDAVLVNDAMARTYWPGEDPVGKRVRYGTVTSPSDPMTVVGVVGSVRHMGLDEAPRPELYRHASTNPMTAPIFAVRVGSDPLDLVPAVRTIVQQVDPGVALANIDVLSAVADQSLRGRRVGARLAIAFGGLAFLLSMVGLYGVVTQGVVERVPEFGIRMALGAEPREVMALVLRQGSRLVAAGLAVGLAIALLATRVLRTFLVDVSPADPATYALVGVLVAATALAGTVFPARRAARIDASRAVRSNV